MLGEHLGHCKDAAARAESGGAGASRELAVEYFKTADDCCDIALPQSLKGCIGKLERRVLIEIEQQPDARTFGMRPPS